MNDIEDLLFDSYRRTIDNCVNYVINNPQKIDDVLKIAFSDNKKLASRAARVVYYVSNAKPSIIIPYYSQLLNNIQYLNNESVKSSILRTFLDLDLPDNDEQIGILANICLDIMDNPVEKAALKVYAIDILYSISTIYPELKRELKLIIENHFENCKPSFYARAKMILNKL